MIETFTRRGESLRHDLSQPSNAIYASPNFFTGRSLFSQQPLLSHPQAHLISSDQERMLEHQMFRFIMWDRQAKIQVFWDLKLIKIRGKETLSAKEYRITPARQLSWLEHCSYMSSFWV